MNSFSTYLSYLPKRFTVLLVGAALLIAPVLAVNAQEANGPMFNIYPDAAVTGDERDFLRVDTAGGDNFTNSVEACSGEVDLWIYVHNGQVEEHNGQNFDGPGVALDTRVAIDLPNSSSNSHEPEATITASNAATVADTAFITCGGHETSVSYVDGTARGYSVQRGNFQISDQIVSAGGTLIGPFADDGKVPGCWDYRVWIKITVKVEKEEKEEVKPIVKCVSLTGLPASLKPDEAVEFTGKASAENADIVKYVFEFGDGNSKTVTTGNTSATASHAYAQVGNYTAKVTVHFDADGKEIVKTSDKCVEMIKVEKEPKQPPVEPPVEELPNTGIGGVISGVFGTGALGLSVRSWLESRSMLRAGILKREG